MCSKVSPQHIRDSFSAYWEHANCEIHPEDNSGVLREGDKILHVPKNKCKNPYQSETRKD